ncbi:MAG: DegV family protein [Clostridia bacterium]|nr:DegV family protein [Clostridia bacterium]
MSVFFCDSNCELWHTKAKELGLNVIKMDYIVDGEEYFYDLGENTDFKAFYDKMRAGSVPKTSALNAQDYINYFEPHLKAGEDIIYVHFSSKLSGTFNNLNTAIDELKKTYPERKIDVVDTLSISMGAGIIVYFAGRMWKDGATNAEIIKWVEENRGKFAGVFLVEKLDYLHRGGRISATTKIVGNLLGIKPKLAIGEDGTLEKVGTSKGFSNGIGDLIKTMKEIGEDVAKYPIVVLSADNEKFENFLEEQIRKEFGIDVEIWRQPVGPVIGTHCGPGTVAVVFHSSRRC